MSCNNSIIDVSTAIGPRTRILLGVWDTLNVRSQSFDLTAWVNAYGDGSVIILHQRPGDELPYEVQGVTFENGIATWTFDETDTAAAGTGAAAVVYMVGEEYIARTPGIPTYVGETVGMTGSVVPDPWESWYTRVLEASEAAQEAAADAEAAAQTAIHQPIVGDNGNWWTWDADAGAYVDTGEAAQGPQGEQGPQGVQGPQGIPGEVTLEQLATAFPTDSASGNPATFDDGADGIPVQSLVATIPYMPYEIKPGWYLNEQTNIYKPAYTGSITPRTIVFKAKPSTTYTITSGIPGTMRVIATTVYPLLNGSYSNRAKATDNDNPVSCSITTGSTQKWITVQFFIEDDVTYRSATIEAALAGWSTSPMLSFGTLTITANGEAVTADWSAQGDIYGGTVDFTNGVVTGTVDSTGTELDPPVVYNIDPIPVASVYGSNSISSEVGSLAVEYRADPDTILDGIEDELALRAPIASPAFTGTPTAPTPAEGDDSTKIATTAFVSKAVYDAVVNSMITDTASGSIATFPDGADGIPVKSMTVDIDPVQDLHGYASPWPAGGGINLFDKDAITAGKWLDVDTGAIVTGSASYSISDYIPIKAGVTYAFSASGSTRCWTYDSDKTPIARIQTNTFTATADGYFIFTIHTASYDINTTMFVAGSAVPGTYSPYSNVCPIVGWTGATVPWTGKNLFNPTGVTYKKWNLYSNAFKTVADSSSIVTVSATADDITITTLSGYYGVGIELGACPYDRVASVPSSIGGAIQFWSAYEDGATRISTGSTSCAIPANTAGFLAFRVDSATTVTTKVQVEVGAAGTDWTPFNGTIYTVSFGQTVYGGDAEYIGGGKWRVTPRMASVDLGTLTWTKGSTVFYATVSDKKNGRTNLICSIYTTETGGTQTDETIVGNANSNIIYVMDSSQTGDAIAFTAAMSGVQLVYELATPVSFIVDGPNPETLYGDNNVWADCGAVTLIFRADTALYIDKKLGA